MGVKTLKVTNTIKVKDEDIVLLELITEAKSVTKTTFPAITA